MMGTFFLKTKMDGSRSRLVALPGQTLNSEPIDTAKFIKGSRAIREQYPIGTVFATNTLVDSVTHYGAGQLFPMVDPSALVETGHCASPEIWKEWNTFAKTLPLPSEEPVAAASVKCEPLFAHEASLFDGLEEAPVTTIKPSKGARGGAKGEPLAKKSGGTHTLEDLIGKKPEPAPKPAVPLLEEIRRDFKVPSIKDSGFYVSESNWQLLIRNIRRKVNTMLTGPTGTGKTELVRMIGKALGLEVSIFDMGSMFDPTVQMLGSHRLEAGSSVFDYAPFAKAVQKPGIILLDELSRAPISTNNLLFPCLDSRRSLPVEQAGAKEETKISVHPDCVFIATANIGSMYTGTQELDAALKNRFFNLELGYMPESAEIQVLHTRSGISKEDAANIVKVAGKIRSLFGKGELSSSISTRETLCVAELVADGFTAIQAMELVILPQFEGTATDGERSVVRSCFMAA